MKCLKFSQCLCESCENMKQMYIVLKKNGAKYHRVSDTIKASVCKYEGDWAKLACISRECEDCGVHSVIETLRSQVPVPKLLLILFVSWYMFQIQRQRSLV